MTKFTPGKPLNGTRWSTRSRARAVGFSKATVQRIWRDNGLAPHRTKAFKVSNEPHFAERLVDLVGLSLDPLRDRLVLNGIQRICPDRNGRRKRRPAQDGRPLKRYRQRGKVERTIAWLCNHHRLRTLFERYPRLFIGFAQLA